MTRHIEIVMLPIVINLMSSLTFDDISPAYIASSELGRLIEFLNELDVQCTFFVVPSSLEDKEFISHLKMAREYGHELALHGYLHVKNEFGILYPIPLPFPIPSFEKQREHLKKGIEKMLTSTGVKPLGFRAPYYLYNNASLKALSSLGFHYNSSSTLFKPAHKLRLRLRWARRFKPFVTNGIVEISVSGDYTYDLETSNDFSFRLRRALKDFEWVKSNGGVFVLNNHPQQIKEKSYLFLGTLVKKLSKQTDFLKLYDIAEIFMRSE